MDTSSTQYGSGVKEAEIWVTAVCVQVADKAMGVDEICKAVW